MSRENLEAVGFNFKGLFREHEIFTKMRGKLTMGLWFNKKGLFGFFLGDNFMFSQKEVDAIKGYAKSVKK